MEKEQKNSLLIVDDEKVNLDILNLILGPQYTIYSTRNGADAITKAAELLPDLILLDILMPDMDGYEVLAALKKSEKTQKIPIIFITGLSSDEDEAKGLALDAADYITKPFAAKIVKLRVRNQMQIINQMRTIERLSMIDQLTEIPNRRSFDERLFLEWNQAIREKTPISILVMDVDKFKYYNDTYGHQQGDVVLKTVAKVFSQSIRRPADFVARWGGEEFTVLLPNTVAGGAMEVAETIRAAVENTVILCADGTETKVTISIGVFTQIPEQSCTTDTFITNADEALYTAKRTGRNKVVHFSQCEPEAEG